jgi:hypothetical protein
VVLPGAGVLLSLPAVVSGDDESARDLLSAYAEVYLREEIQDEGIVRNIGAFARFLDVAAAQSGEILNAARGRERRGNQRSNGACLLRDPRGHPPSHPASRMHARLARIWLGCTSLAQCRVFAQDSGPSSRASARTSDPCFEERR